MSDSVPALPSFFDPRLRMWRWRIFGATWLSYVGFYFCRQPFGIVKSDLGKELGFGATELGDLWAIYLITYAAGQFLAGYMGDRIGPRKNLLIGMGASALCGIGFSVSSSYLAFVGLMVLLGVSQATGWSGNVGTMAAWFHRHERGRVMGWWATNFTVGSLLAKAFASYVLGHQGWRASFVAGSIVLGLVVVLFYFNQRNRPEDLGFPPVVDPREPEEDTEATGPTRFSRAVWINIGLVGAFYFFAKLIRYAVDSWAPFFFNRNFGVTGELSGYLTTLFALAGIPAVILTGWLSDRFFNARRVPASLLMMVALVVCCVALYTLGTTSATVFAICLALLGLTLIGPDALMTGAGAMDIGKGRGATLATGVISGVGSLGPIVQELAIGRLYDRLGGDLSPIFFLLLASAIAGTAVLVFMQLRNRSGRADV